ncbi:hypothetical protein AMTRI_Chr03g149110 [Amborella trichopoda]
MAGISFAWLSNKSHLFLNTTFLFLLCFYLTTLFQSPTTQLQFQSTSPTSTTTSIQHNIAQESCQVLQIYKSSQAKCEYLKSTTLCESEGYIDYLWLFYCVCGGYPALGYTLLIFWLIVLFYLLGNTAADYFCYSLESLSCHLKLSPALAGVTLLSLGNGAPDVFAGIVSFIGAGKAELGINSILGGAFFVSCFVSGLISMFVAPQEVLIHKKSFIRDVCFLLFSLVSLLVILIIGKINIWGAISFTLLYVVYVLVVWACHFMSEKNKEESLFTKDPILPTSRTLVSNGCEENPQLSEPLLSDNENEPDPIEEKKRFGWVCSLKTLVWVFELPLSLPRRLTIPLISNERWSKPFAIASVTLAPIFLSALWSSQESQMGRKMLIAIYIAGASLGIVLGILVYLTTDRRHPPRKFLFPWLAGGFLMSVVWSYIIAEELVALLVSLGNIAGVNTSILGLTVLAWGNSIGDLIANFTLAMKAGPDGTQFAISGCYAGPVFNTLVGLGSSLVFSSWKEYPSSYSIPKDSTLYQTVGFLVGGLLWALLILPRKGMRLNRTFGVGLLSIYLCFLCLRLTEAIWSLK